MAARTCFILFFALPVTAVAQPVTGSSSAGATRSDGGNPVRKDICGDPLPGGATARIGSTRLRHSEPIDAAVFSPDGKWLASHSGWEKFISVWATSDGRLRRRLGAAGAVKLAFAPDGNSLAAVVATGSFTGEMVVECWDLANGRRTLRLRDEEHDPRDAVLVFSPDGKDLYFGRSRLRRVDLATGKVAYQLPMGQAADSPKDEVVTALALTPDGTALVTAEGDGTVRFRDAATGRERRRAERTSASGLALSADGKLLALATAGPIEVWQLPPTPEQVPGIPIGKRRLPREEGGPLIGLAFASDGHRLLSLSAGGAACLWDVPAGKRSIRRELPAGRGAAVAFDPAGRPLVVTADDSSHGLHLWDIAEGKAAFAERHTGGRIACMTFSPDGKILVTGDEDKAVRFWQAGTGKLLGHVRLPHSPCQVNFTGDGQTVVAGGEGQWWSVPVGKLTAANDPRGGPARPAAVALRGPAAGWPWHHQGKAHRGRLPPWKTDVVRECTITPDGLLVDLERTAVRVLHAGSGKKICELQGSKYFGAALAPNRRALAVLQDQAVVALADLGTGAGVDRFDVPPAEMIPGRPWLLPRQAFAPGGRLLAVGTPRGSVLFRDVATGEQVHKLTGHDVAVALLAFAPDGRTLACAYRDTTVLLWDVAAVTPKPLPAAAPAEKAWQDLASGDAAAAWKAHWALAGSPQAVPLLRERLRPARRIDLRPLGQRIKELASPQFAVRDRAFKDLQDMGQAAEPALRQALKDSGSLETQRRVQRLLDKLAEARRNHLQELRAVAVLEQVASADARQVLEALAAGDPEAPLTLAAQAARKRLGK
jgi:WD40 repeat protein